MNDAGALRKLDAHIWEREQHDHYVEPSWCSARLFEEEKFEGLMIWDPCCGFGTIPKSALAAGHIVAASDIVDRGYDSPSFETVDFFKSSQHVSNIVCNPPFNIADQFAQHALKLAERKVALIFPTARLNAAHWIKGLPLARVWLLTPRPSMPPGHVIASGEKPGGGKMDYCWLVFSQGRLGPPDLRWLRRDKEAS